MNQLSNFSITLISYHFNMSHLEAIFANSINWKVEKSDDITNIVFQIYFRILHYLYHLLAMNEFMEINHLFPQISPTYFVTLCI